jgi:predicted ATPase
LKEGEGNRELGLQGSQGVVHGGKVTHFRNEIKVMYNEAFTFTEDNRRQKDREKPWLDDTQFKEIVYGMREGGTVLQEG